MPLDPVNAFALADNVIQFIDFGCNLISNSADIYRSATGATAENIELGLIIEHIQEHIKPLRATSDSSSRASGYNKILYSCEKVARELLEAINKLKVDSGPHRKWKSFNTALRAIWKKKEISQLQERLVLLRGEIVVQATKDSRDYLIDELRQVRANTKALNVNMVAQFNSITLAVEALGSSSAQHLHRTDFDHLRSLIDVSMSTLDQISKEITILKSLHYTSIEKRHSDIAESHRRTFAWIFDSQKLSQDDPRSRITLKDWLSSGQGLYWVSGKPGSGKSTFMKWLYQERRAKEALRRWAEPDELVTASFYFWISGTQIQKRSKGCSSLYSSEYSANAQNSYLYHIQPFSSWGRGDLNTALARLKTSVPNKKFCFFIDGLDEYDGDHFDVIDIMSNLVESSHVKICLSSRHWNCFEDAFGVNAGRKLYLHHLTREDVELYTRDKLSRTNRSMIPVQDTIAHNTLISEIVDRAQGVFLWVYLVVRSLRHGLVNGDSVAILQRRLRSLPADLELYFKHILSTVDEVYKEKFGSMFLVAVEAD